MIFYLYWKPDRFPFAAQERKFVIVLTCLLSETFKGHSMITIVATTFSEVCAQPCIASSRVLGLAKLERLSLGGAMCIVANQGDGIKNSVLPGSASPGFVGGITHHHQL